MAISKYSKKFKLKVHKSGLVVSKSKPYLAGSPDGIVRDKDNKIKKITEAKCPYTARNFKIIPSVVPYIKRNSKGKYVLKKKHDYMYQCQGNMFVTGAQKCDLVIYTFKDLVRISIKRDNRFINKMLRKLDRFYVEHFKSEYVERHLYKKTDGYAFPEALRYRY